MKYLTFQANRAYRTICCVSGTWIEETQPAYHEPKRNWHCHPNRAERMDIWIGQIEDGLKNKPPIIVQPNVPPQLEKIANARSPTKPVQQSLF